MKIKLFLLAAAAATVTLTGCNGPEEGTKPLDEPGYTIQLGTPTEFDQLITVTPTIDEAKTTRYIVSVLTANNFRNLYYGNARSYIMQYIDEEVKAAPDQTVRAVMERLTQDAEGNTNVGSKDVLQNYLFPSTEYYVVVCGVNLTGKIMFEPTAVPFTTVTPPALVEQSCTFDWTITPHISGVDASFDVKPSDQTVAYMTDCMNVETYNSSYGGTPEGLRTNLFGMIRHLAELNAAASIPTFLMGVEGEGGVLSKGDQPNIRLGSILSPEKNYIAFVCGVDKYGRATTPVEVKTFKTPAFTPSDATIKGAARLFDGDAAVAKDPVEFPADDTENVAGYAGGWFVRYKPEFGATSVKWKLSYVDSAQIPEMSQDPTKMSEGALYAWISNDDRTTLLDVNEYPAFDISQIPKTLDVTLYIFSYAVNAAGEPGHISSGSIKLSSSNVSSIDTIDDDPYTRAAMRMTRRFTSALRK